MYPQATVIDIFKFFWKAIKPQKWLFFVMVISIILANIALIATPVLYKKFFDTIVVDAPKDMVASELIKIIIFVALLHGVFWALYRVATITNNYYQSYSIARLKSQSYDYLIEHSYSFFSSNFVGSLVQRINRAARSFERMLDRFTWELLPLIVRVLSVFIIVSLINLPIAFAILIWVFLFLSINIIFSRWKLRYDVKVAQVDSKTTGYLADTISNQNAIQLFARSKVESEGYRKITDEQAKATVFSWNLDAVIEGVQAFLGFFMQFLLFFFAIKFWKTDLISVGFFVLLQVYLITLIDQLWGFTRIVRDVYHGYADAKELVEMLLLPHEIEDAPGAKELVVSKGEVKFKNLHFSFHETRNVLKDINVVIKPGEKVALVGPSGAGKTTFVRLLLRLYAPTSGQIFIDKQDISRVTQNSVRRNIAMVPQDTVLFHRTLAENIGYGKKDATREEIERAARIAHCDDFIKNLPRGLETYVGERGVKLSGGERQRVAVARAIVKNAPILILDEATSSLDSRSEALIQDALGHLMRGKTTIVIAHRLSTIQKMDRIIVIDEGKIIETGSHRDLLAKKDSLYHKLWTLQAGGFLGNIGQDVDEKEEEAEDESEAKESFEDEEEKGKATLAGL